MKKIPFSLFFLLLLLLYLSGCMNQSSHQSEQLSSIQIIDRNGFKETVNAKERLLTYNNVNFLAPQPYEKVVRIYTRNQDGKTTARLTSYHENGGLFQYLDVVNGRACGVYREWHANGNIRLDVIVIGGLGDLSEEAQMNWIFDGVSRAWDDRGNLLAEINYEKGILQGNAFYYESNSNLSKIIPYRQGEVHGDVISYSEKGECNGKASYDRGKKEGIAHFKGNVNSPAYFEEYKNDLLVRGTYHDLSGNVLVTVEEGFGKKAYFEKGFLISIEEIQNGVQQGVVERFDEKGQLISSFELKEGMKHGQEWIYYPSKNSTPQPKLYLEWYQGNVHGICRSWYLNGGLESEKEVIDNHKQGISSAWYLDHSLMFIEEYENDQLYTGKYMKKGQEIPVSVVENGEGVATLYDKEGYFLKRISYKKGLPLDESEK